MGCVNVSNSTKITSFHSVGKNYNINYNSNTNTNFDLNQLYNTVLSQLFTSQINAPNPCPGGYCTGLYDHFTASFSLDVDEDETDDGIDETNPRVGNIFQPMMAPLSSDRIDNQTTTNPDDDNKLEILQTQAVEDYNNQTDSV